MRTRMSIVSAIGALLLALPATQALAQHHPDESEAGHSHEKAMIHGGDVTMTPHHHFETLFTGSQERLYVYDHDQNPVNDPKDAMVTMTLMTKDGKSDPVKLTYHAPDADKGCTQGYFEADKKMDIEDGAMKAMFTVKGLQDEPIEFRTAVTQHEQMMYACPMGDSSPMQDPGKCPKCGMQMKPMGHGDQMHMEGMKGEHMEGGHMKEQSKGSGGGSSR